MSEQVLKVAAVLLGDHYTGPIFFEGWWWLELRCAIAG